MKAIFTSMVLASASAFAQQTAPEPTLKPGSEVKLEAVSSAKWIQGEPLKTFEPGKVYMFECWATWCGPCIAAIPHVNELHKKYHDKGLRVYGMNVWEDGADKVEKFVKGKGDGMSYPVAYTGKGSAFENDWLKAAGVRGIPHAFIVKDGKLVLTSHPSQLTDSVIEALLSGDEGTQKAADEINAAKDARERTSKVMQEFRKAASANDTAAMEAKVAEFEKLDPASAYLPTMKLDLMIAKKDWTGAAKAIEEMPEGPGKQMTINMTASKVSMESADEYPVDFLKVVSKSYGSMLEGGMAPSNPMSFLTLSSLQWKTGEKEESLASARKAVATAADPKTGRSMPAAPFERFAKSVEEGKLPTRQEFGQWVIESRKTNPVPATKIQPAPAKE